MGSVLQARWLPGSQPPRIRSPSPRRPPARIHVMGDFVHQPDVLAGFEMAAVVLCVLTLPLLLELLVLTTASLFPSRRRNKPAAALRLTIVVPAHNEEVLIVRCVDSIAKQLGENTSLLVIAHNCIDDTAERARNAGADVLRLDDPSHRGKACALRFAFAHALRDGAEAVVVVDADSIVGNNFVESMQAALSSSSAEAVQCRYRVLPAGAGAGPSLTGIAFQGINLVRPRGRDRLGLSAGIFGNGFGLRREVLERVPYSADSVVEDLEYHIQLVAAGMRVRFLETATVFGEMPQGTAGNRTQRARWEGGRLLMVRAYLYRLPRAIVRGHLRLLEPLLDILSLPIAMGALALVFALFVPSAWLRWYAVAGLLILSYHFLVAAKAGPDFWRSMRVVALAPRYIVWKLLLMPKIVLNSRRNASWVRTQRDKPADFSSRPHPDALE
jgi:cellulose synthase/poly-beta-1,6-N-acetylglucosamine synthase-like glycosyltransferase